MNATSLGLWLVAAGLASVSTSVVKAVQGRISLRSRVRDRALRSTQVAIAEAPVGEVVKIMGRVELTSTPLIAPFSGRRCSHFEASVDQRKGTRFFRRARSTSSQPFWVVDDTARVLVDPAGGAMVEVVVDHLWTGSDIDAEKRFELEQHLYQNGPEWLRLLGAKNDLRYCEGAIEEGEMVTVVGSLGVRREPEPFLYRDHARRLVLSPDKRFPLFISDGLHFA
jgi:hypothetical protein